jgi:hypothetical protein
MKRSPSSYLQLLAKSLVTLASILAALVSIGTALCQVAGILHNLM